MAELSALNKARSKREEFRRYLIKERNFPPHEASILTGIQIEEAPPALIVYALWDPGRVRGPREKDLKVVGDWEADVNVYTSHGSPKRKFAMTSGNHVEYSVDSKEFHYLTAIAFLRYGNYEVA